MELNSTSQEFNSVRRSGLERYCHFMGWHNRLLRVANERAINWAELSRATGIHRDSIYKYKSGKVASPRGDVLEKISAALGIDYEWLLTGKEPDAGQLPIVGYVSAGELFIPIDDHTKGGGMSQADFRVNDLDDIAVQVRGQSMVPAYRPGDILACRRHEGAAIEGIVGRDCVVMTEDGEGYLKVLRPGSRRGLYDLESYNRTFETLEDRQLEWAALVKLVLRA